jgi:ribosomal protein S18 acetylase RimI-like enzyme
VRIRELAWGDFDGWVALYYNRYDEVRTNKELGVYTYETKPTLPEEAALFADVWKAALSGDLVASVAEADGKVVGVCTIHRKGRHSEDRHTGILAIEVHPDWRGRGVGSRLLDHALPRCSGRFEIVYLTVLEQNARARGLYRRFGFVESGRMPRAFKRDGVYSDDILMWWSAPAGADGA